MPVALRIIAAALSSVTSTSGARPVGMKNQRSPVSIGPKRQGTSWFTSQYMMALPCACASAKPGARNTML